MEANRRTIIKGAGAAGVIGGTAAFTSACGTDDQKQGSGQESGGAGASVPADDVPVGSGTVVDETYVVTQPKAGEFHAFTSVCTHQGCQVRTVTEDKITCPCHGSQFSTTSGEVITGPATDPLQKFTVEESGGTLTIS
ncbi:Rieske (2Fe-2S) protein [Brevibacterium sp.]|uniref:QcrA and Rieske domain-containing protein n=1 Tax=Brevibacterium sp. TaxID=1701 RepID=UPI002810F189|nr:Rieske (2Fe-2S) protein [Brevibacterium sp.]